MSAINSETTNILARMLQEEREERGRLESRVERSKIEVDDLRRIIEELRQQRDATVGPPTINVTNKIELIKLIRERRSIGLKEAKDLVDRFLDASF